MKKSIEIKLDKTRNLRFGFAAISRIEDKLDKAMSEIDFDHLRMKEVAIMIWAGLAHEDETLTPERVLNIVDDGDTSIEDIIVTLGKAITEAFSGPGSGEKK